MYRLKKMMNVLKNFHARKIRNASASDCSNISMSPVPYDRVLVLLAMLRAAICNENDVHDTVLRCCIDQKK